MSFLRTRWQRKYDFFLEYDLKHHFDDSCSNIKYDWYQTSWDQCIGITKCPVLNDTLVIITKWACHLHRNKFKSVIPSYNFYHNHCHLTCLQGTSSTKKLLPIYLFSWIHCILCNVVTRCCLSYITVLCKIMRPPRVLIVFFRFELQ